MWFVLDKSGTLRLTLDSDRKVWSSRTEQRFEWLHHGKIYILIWAVPPLYNSAIPSFEHLPADLSINALVAPLKSKRLKISQLLVANRKQSPLIPYSTTRSHCLLLSFFAFHTQCKARLSKALEARWSNSSCNTVFSHRFKKSIS